MTALLERPPLVLIPQFFGCLIFDRRNSRYMPFDRESTALLCQLATTPIGALLAASGPRRAIVRSFVDYFYRKGFFSVDGRLSAEILDLCPPADHLAGPLAVHLEVAATCNLTCRHCFAGPLPRRDPPLRLEELEQLFSELAGMGSFRLGLTGGEPLSRPDLLDIIDCATARGLHPCITTNGLLIDERMARELGKRRLVWLNVSLDGASATTNDAIRGHGTFERVRQKLRLLGRYARFTLAFTLMRHNLHEIEACARLAHEVGAHTAVFRPLYPVGIARDHLQLMPTYDQYADALVRLQRAGHRDDVGDNDGDNVGDDCGHAATRALDPLVFGPEPREPHQARVFHNRGCGAGNLVASISIHGAVNPCSFLGPAHDAGNVRERSFADIWHASAGFQAMRALSPITADNGESDSFQGGCRARALTLNGHIDARDPWHDAWRERRERAPAPHPMDNLDLRSETPSSVGDSARSGRRRLPVLPSRSLISCSTDDRPR